jgi:hypothetical protein
MGGNYVEQERRHSRVSEVGGDAGAHGTGTENGNFVNVLHQSKPRRPEARSNHAVTAALKRCVTKNQCNRDCF